MEDGTTSQSEPILILSRHVIWGFVVAGPAFLLLHWAATGSRVFDDWSWLLGLLITTAALFLALAVYVLDGMIDQMDWRLSQGKVNVRAKHLYKSVFADRNFFISAVVFGILNGFMGFGFGLPYCPVWQSCRRLAAFAALPNDTVMLGYVLAGMICGMAAYGILAVCILLIRFSRHAAVTFEPKSPDGCAGTSYIGEALIVFSMITLIVGVMISIYILQTKWTGPERGFVGFLKTAWIIFPYAMSLTALAVPALPVIAALHEFKFHRQVALKAEDARLRESLENAPASAAERLRIAAQLQAIETEANALYEVRIWPFSADANTKYATVLAGNAFVQVVATVKWLPSWLAKLL